MGAPVVLLLFTKIQKKKKKVPGLRFVTSIPMLRASGPRRSWSFGRGRPTGRRLVSGSWSEGPGWRRRCCCGGCCCCAPADRLVAYPLALMALSAQFQFQFRFGFRAKRTRPSSCAAARVQVQRRHCFEKSAKPSEFGKRSSPQLPVVRRCQFFFRV